MSLDNYTDGAPVGWRQCERCGAKIAPGEGLTGEPPFCSQFCEDEWTEEQQVTAIHKEGGACGGAITREVDSESRGKDYSRKT